MNIIIQVDGLDEALRRNQVAAAGVPDALYRGMQRSVTYVWMTKPPYPPPIPDSTYRRTGTLDKELTTDVTRQPGVVIGTFGSNTDYAPWVISSLPVVWGGKTRGPQARVHKGRWWTMQQHVESKAGAIVQFFVYEIRRLFGGA